MKETYNRVNVDWRTERVIRKLFFQQMEMKNICNKVSLTERVIRRIVKENKWDIARERYLKYLCYLSFLNNTSFEKMSKMTGVKLYALCRIHKKYNTPKPRRSAWNKRITDGVEREFIQEYMGGKSSNKIAQKYGFKRRETVLGVLKKHNIIRRPARIVTYYQEDFFEKINSPEKAYVLGLIMTDGYIIKDYNGFGIQLTKTDGYLLKKIAKIIGARQGVSQIICNAKREYMPNAKDMVRLTVHNRKISEDLKSLGVVRSKSKVLRYKGCVPRRYLSHFFRGLIDGDGCIHVSKSGRIQIQVASASREFVRDLIRINTGFKFHLHNSAISVLYLIGGKAECLRFCKWIYKNKDDLYLRRKYAKVQNQIN